MISGIEMNMEQGEPLSGAFNEGEKGPLVLFDMDGTLLQPDSWRENGVGFLYPDMANIIAPFVADHRCGMLTGCEVYRIKGALRATDSRLDSWLSKGHFYCEMGLVQLVDGVKKLGATEDQMKMLDSLREDMGKHYALFPGSEVMITLTPRYDRNETIDELRDHFCKNFPHWADRLTVTTSSEAVDLMPYGFTKANGIEMARAEGYYPIHFVADSWGDMEALEKVRDERLGLAALVGQARADVKDRWKKGSRAAPDPKYHVQLQGEKVDAIIEFLELLEDRFPGEY